MHSERALLIVYKKLFMYSTMSMDRVVTTHLKSQCINIDRYLKADGGDVSAAAPRGSEQINSKPNCTKREAKLREKVAWALFVTLGDRDGRRSGSDDRVGRVEISEEQSGTKKNRTTLLTGGCFRQTAVNRKQ